MSGRTIFVWFVPRPAKTSPNSDTDGGLDWRPSRRCRRARFETRSIQRQPHPKVGRRTCATEMDLFPVRGARRILASTEFRIGGTVAVGATAGEPLAGREFVGQELRRRAVTLREPVLGLGLILVAFGAAFAVRETTAAQAGSPAAVRSSARVVEPPVRLTATNQIPAPGPLKAVPVHHARPARPAATHHAAPPAVAAAPAATVAPATTVASRPVTAAPLGTSSSGSPSAPTSGAGGSAGSGAGESAGSGATPPSAPVSGGHSGGGSSGGGSSSSSSAPVTTGAGSSSSGSGGSSGTVSGGG